MYWIPMEQGAQDVYGAFRCVFHLEQAAQVEVELLGSGWFTSYMDGAYLAQGPARFELSRPEYDRYPLELAGGRHVLALHAHHIGVTTRILEDMAPFVHARVLVNGAELPMEWRAARLEGYGACVRRINPQLGWIEWCDTRRNPEGWHAPEFDDSAWAAPVSAAPPAPIHGHSGIGPVLQFEHYLEPMAQGPLAENFGYELDDVPARFFLRDLECSSLPPTGVWRRYDLGRVRLGRPSFVLDLPAGAIVQFAYAEHLEHDRVPPYVTLSAGPSCNLDHYIARGGEQRFEPITPKGGRFMEVHILSGAPEAARFVEERYLERCYHEEAEGAFACNDGLLNRIWQVGVDTYRGCAEDAVIDNPTRERGQWTGDVVSVGLYIAMAAYSDLRLFRRGLQQSALCAREDGLVAGMSPGGTIFMTSYAAQWFTACLDYYHFTGDRSLLEEMHPYALKNAAAFSAHVDEHGLREDWAWTFIDWGYDRGDGPTNSAVNLHYLRGLRSLAEWMDLIGDAGHAGEARAMADRIEGILRRWLDGMLAKPEGWVGVGYHATALALALGFVAPEQQTAAIASLKDHMLRCFPNNPDAPRNADPAVQSRQIITPYFAHYGFPALIEHGEMDFILDQYRQCWGWALEDGRTTWVEVFDTRWSHCHQWAGCPTWQLSQYVLGLRPRYDLGEAHFEWVWHPGSLDHAEGRIPMPQSPGFCVEVAWTLDDGGCHYTVKTPSPITIHGMGAPGLDEPRRIDGNFEVRLSPRA